MCLRRDKIFTSFRIKNWNLRWEYQQKYEDNYRVIDDRFRNGSRR